MATGQYIGVNGVARKVVSPYVGVEGVARNVKSGYVGVNGVARLFFAPESGGAAVLEVEKITSDTYANGTTYTAEEFILLDIYPKTGGTVNVTYGGLTKTITDTSGAEEPNAQQVFFGTFNGVTDSVATPASGELTIEGDYVAFGCGGFASSKIMSTDRYLGITAVKSFGEATIIPGNAFGSGLAGCTKLVNVKIPSGITSIGDYAFSDCNHLENVSIGNGVTSIGDMAFARCYFLTSVTIPANVVSMGVNPFISSFTNNVITVASGNTAYKIDGNCLVKIATNTLIAGFSDSVIPSYIETIGSHSFYSVTSLTSLAIGNSLKTINNYAFYGCTGLTSLTIGNSVTSIEKFAFGGCTGLTSITIPDSVTSISGDAFSKCTGLTSVVFENTSGWYATQTENGDASTGTPLYMDDTSVNVDILVNDFSGWYIYRS